MIFIAGVKQLSVDVKESGLQQCSCVHCRRAGAMSKPMTATSTVGHSERYPDTLPLNLVQRATSSCGLKPSTASAMTATGVHPHCHTSLPSYQRLQQPASLVTSSAGASSTSKPRCFECSLCGKRFKVSQETYVHLSSCKTLILT